MRLIHYSDTPLHSVEPRDQIDVCVLLSKPAGLWVSVEGPDDWRQWCISESFRDIDQQHATEVVLAPRHGCLVISSPFEMRAFHARYARQALATRMGIDWRAVAGSYCGIIIAPYQYESRISDMHWYYTWDCASGCIWDSAAVAMVRPLRRQLTEGTDSDHESGQPQHDSDAQK